MQLPAELVPLEPVGPVAVEPAAVLVDIACRRVADGPAGVCTPTFPRAARGTARPAPALVLREGSPGCTLVGEFADGL